MTSAQSSDRGRSEAIELLQREDLPSAPRLQIASAFPADAMVSTPIGERARLLSAIEQRLEESLAIIDGVRTARVHVSYAAAPSQARMQPQEPKMHVAAVVVHEEGVDSHALLQSVKRFLRNAFVQVEYDNVSVILSAEKPMRRLGTTKVEHRTNVALWAALATTGGGRLPGFPLLLAAGQRLVHGRPPPGYRSHRTGLLSE